MRKIYVLLIVLILCGKSILAYGRDTSDIYSHYLRGVIYFNQEKYEQALKEFKEAIKLSPESLTIRFKKALVLFKMEKYKEAEKELVFIKDKDPDYIDAYFTLIFVYEALNDQKKQKQIYREFLEKTHDLHPENIDIAEYLAEYYYVNKEYEKAIKVYEDILKSKPDYIDGKYMLGFLYDTMGKRKIAIQIWKDILKKNPNHADTLNALGYAYAEEGINLDEAKKMIEKALELAPDNPAYLDSLGWVYFKKGKYELAEEYLKKAGELFKDPVIFEHLGDLYIKLNKNSIALEFYNKALKMDPQNSRLKEKIKRYEQRR